MVAGVLSDTKPAIFLWFVRYLVPRLHSAPPRSGFRRCSRPRRRRARTPRCRCTAAPSGTRTRTGAAAAGAVAGASCARGVEGSRSGNVRVARGGCTYLCAEEVFGHGEDVLIYVLKKPSVALREERRRNVHRMKVRKEWSIFKYISRSFFFG